MPRPKRNRVVEEEAVDSVEEKNVAEETVVEEAEEVVETSGFPVVVGNKKFQTVAHDGGYVVYNPSGERVSGVVTKDKADDLVREMNRHGGLK